VSREQFANIQKAAHGGLNTHNIKKRLKHYSTPASEEYIYNEYFSVHPDDFKKFQQ